MSYTKLKILHYIPVYAPAWKFGGPVLSVSQLCEGLVQLGHEVEVFTSNAGLDQLPHIPVNQPILRQGVKVTYFQQQKGMGINSPGMERAIRERSHEFDVIHVTGVWQVTSNAACRAAKQSDIPYVVSPRGALGPYSWSQKTAKKLLYYLWKERFNVSHASAIHYTAQQELEECRWLNLPGQTRIIPNGLDIQAWKPDLNKAKEWRKSQNISEDCFILLSVGRLHDKKGLDLIPKTLENLYDRNWRMIFVGGDDDGTKHRLIKQLEKLNLIDQVQFIDRCEPSELPVLYSAANLFVLPSRHENFGNVVIEALACGCPVLISDRVGLHQEVSTGRVGWVLPRNVQVWTELIRDLQQNRFKLDAAAFESRHFIESRFSMKESAVQMTDLYRKLISESTVNN